MSAPLILDGPIEREPVGTALAALDQRPTSLARGGGISAGELLMRAIELGTPPEQMTMLVDLHERIETRQAKKDFDAAMAAFKAEARSIRHNKTAKVATSGGGEFSYTYASLDEMAETIDPILTRHGLSYRWGNSTLDEKGVMLTCTIIVSHINGHSESSSFTLPVESKSAMSAQQKIGAANKFARRQTLESALGLTTTSEDRDEQEADPTPISEDQAIVIEDMLRETKADRVKFFKYIDADAVAKIRAVDYDKAVRSLEIIREKRQREAKK